MQTLNAVRPLLRAKLVQRQLPSGGWAYSARSTQAALEPSTLAALALRGQQATALRPVLRFLQKTQNPNGSWPAFLGDDTEGSWATSLAVLALYLNQPDFAQMEQALEWLLSLKGRESNWFWKWKFRTTDVHVHFDPEKFGWPWLPNTNSWVVPTAFALLALKHTLCACSSTRAAHRVALGVAMLLDRVCPGGGWNAGNGVVYGVPLAPHPDTTAIALLALSDEPRDFLITASFDWLERIAHTLTAAWSLAWCVVALTAYQRPTADTLQRLLTLPDVENTEDNATLAVVLLALDAAEGNNVLRITS